MQISPKNRIKNRILEHNSVKKRISEQDCQQNATFGSNSNEKNTTFGKNCVKARLSAQNRVRNATLAQDCVKKTQLSAHDRVKK